MQNELKSALIAFLDSKNDSALQSIIEMHPEVVSSGYGEYPDKHRVMDISIGGNSYRVCRQISCAEKLTLKLIPEVLDDPGVPLWLTGEKLRDWAKWESENPSDEPTDWNAWK